MAAGAGGGDVERTGSVLEAEIGRVGWGRVCIASRSFFREEAVEVWGGGGGMGD